MGRMILVNIDTVDDIEDCDKSDELFNKVWIIDDVIC